MWYHYFDAQEVFNSIRCYIGAYVWMTGFGKEKNGAKRLVTDYTHLRELVTYVNLPQSSPAILLAFAYCKKTIILSFPFLN